MGRRLAVFDCPAGVAGDMLLAALVDAGAPLAEVEAVLLRLDLPPVTLAVERVRRGGVEALRLEVRVAEERTFAPEEMRARIAAAGLPPRARARALAAVAALAAGEAAAHAGGPPHFHEVGGVDALVDIVGTMVALEALAVDAAVCPVVTVGAGAVVDGAHGSLPASPPPAAAAILQRGRFPLRFVPAEAELATPTGAAVLAAVAEPRAATVTVERVGLGAGARELASRPNVLRVFLGDEAVEPATRPLVLLEANVDDMTPAALAAARDALLEAGALDAWLEPIGMKKGRSAAKLCVLALEGEEARFADRILRETSTLGVRVASYRRFEAERWVEEVETTLGRVRVKASRWGGRLRRTPEFDDVAALARQLGRPFLEVYEAVSRELDARP